MTRHRLKQAGMVGLIAALVFTGCGMNMSRIRSKKPDVQEFFKHFNYALKSENWGTAERFFSEDYAGGQGRLKQRMEAFWIREDLVEIRFRILNVREADNRTHTRVRWHKSYITTAGILKDMSGTSDIVFKEVGGGLRIFSITGEAFF